jgi:CRISPR-associated protein Csx3
MELFPAVLIGGPPHSGKSVLAYSLTQALRQRGVGHYVLRAAPDGEGDWANEAAQKLVRTLRVKGDFTPAFVDFVCDSLAGRHLPLLVDAGGRPTPEQERIFDYCTHAVLLSLDESERDDWRAIAERHNLPIVAELTSRLEGKSHLTAKSPVLRGVITGLERGATVAGPVFDALVERLAAILYYDPADLRRIHDDLCPVETVIDLECLARTFDVPLDGEKAIWEPRHLPGVLDYLPEAVPLGLYGRGPNWLYAALALLAAPAPFVQFDVRLGWVQAESLRLGTPDPQAPLQIQFDMFPDHVRVEGVLPIAYLDYSQLETLAVPPVTPGVGVLLSGKLPHWLYTSLALTYRGAPWIAVYQPPLGCAVVVHSADAAHATGDCISWPA